MNNTEGRGTDSLDLFGIEVNGITVPAFEQSGNRWYQLAALFRAVDSTGGCPSSKAGTRFFDCGEFQKYRDYWYGTIKGLNLLVEYLCKSQLLLSKYDSITNTALVPTDMPEGNPGITGMRDESGVAPEPDSDAVQASADDRPPDSETAAFRLDMALIDRLYENFAAWVPYLAKRLSIPDNVPIERKAFAVMAISALHPEHIDRPESDTEGIWQGKESILISEAIRRSLLSARREK